MLLAHGGGQTRRAWKNVSGMLGGRGFHVVALDLRGHGDSAWSSTGEYDIADFAADLVAVAQTFDRPAALIGASLGGLAGLIAEGKLAPGTFASLTLVDITPQMEAGGVARVVGFMAAHAREGFASPEDAAKVISEYLPHRPQPSASKGLANYLRLRSDGRYYWHWDPAFIDAIMRRHADTTGQHDDGRSELTDAAAALRLPVHLIRGGSSDLVSPEAAAHFRSIVPHALFTDIAEATHMVVGDRNDAFGAAILQFLESTHIRKSAS